MKTKMAPMKARKKKLVQMAKAFQKKKAGLSGMDWFNISRDSISIAIAIITLIFTLNKCNEAIDLSKRQEAINTIYRIKEKGTLEARARLAYIADIVSKNPRESLNVVIKSVYLFDEEGKNKTELIHDLNLLYNVFDNIALMHRNNLADQKIIQETICEEVKEFSFVHLTLSASDSLLNQLDNSNIIYLDSICDMQE